MADPACHAPANPPRARLRLGPEQMSEAVESLLQSIHHAHPDPSRLHLVSIANGGVALGERLALGLSRIYRKPIPLGVVNTAFHRDDLGRNPIPKSFLRTDLPFYLEEAEVVLVDDVLFSGRTVRAAMNELFDQGRPDRIELAVLCDRGNRRLPIQADHVGCRIDTNWNENVVVVVPNDNPGAGSLTVFLP